MDEFKANVLEYYKCEEESKELNNKVKQVREKKLALSEHIIHFMSKNNIDHCKLPDGTNLNLKIQVQVGSLNKEYIQDTLAAFFNDPKPKPKDPSSLAEQTTELLLSNREVNEKQLLKITKKRSN